MANNKVGLIILDGWGIGDHSEGDAVFNAQTPFFDQLMSENGNATLKTYGEHVGLPEGQMGNSEVGHLNIGAGRIVFQDLAKINNAVETGDILQNKVLLEAIAYAEKQGKPIHLMGLTSHGGVHSSQKHLYALVDMIEGQSEVPVFIHAFTDGRDTEQRNAIRCVGELEEFLEGKRSKLASMIGRYYAMDRDKRWERTKVAFDLLTAGKGVAVERMTQAITEQYEKDITDEFFEPFRSATSFQSIAEGDVVICFNFRTDRCRQITQVLTQADMPEHEMHRIPLHYVTMTRYDESFQGVHVLFEKGNLERTLGEVVAGEKLSQLRVAETEKYPHVTFFFSGGREEPFDGEQRLMVNSPKVSTYDLQPEMSAQEVAAKTVATLQSDQPDFLCLNFANPDMVGHTGVYDAIVKAVETTDDCLRQVVEAGEELGYSFIIIADHGNADKTRQENGKPHTAHTVNPVPVIVMTAEHVNVADGILADVAPTCCALLGIDPPAEMTGRSLISR